MIVIIIILGLLGHTSGYEAKNILKAHMPSIPLKVVEMIIPFRVLFKTKTEHGKGHFTLLWHL